MQTGSTFWDFLKNNLKLFIISSIVILILLIIGIISGVLKYTSKDGWSISYIDNMTVDKKCIILDEIKNTNIRLERIMLKESNIDSDIRLIFKAHFEKFDVYLQTNDPCTTLNQSTISSEIESLNKILANYE